MPFKDLPPRGDVKGGSPRTPTAGIPVSEYQQFVTHTNGHGVWRAIACGEAGIIITLFLAWWTAFQSKGISQKDMQEYVSSYYTTEKRVIAEHTSRQDENIGSLMGKQEKLFETIGEIKSNQKDHDRDITEIKAKLKLTGDYLEEQLKVKK